MVTLRAGCEGCVAGLCEAHGLTPVPLRQCCSGCRPNRVSITRSGYLPEME